MKPQVAVQQTMDATVLEENYHRTPTTLGHQLVDPLRAATAPVALAAVAPWWLMVTLAGRQRRRELLTRGWKESRGRRRSRRLRPRR
jgi:hypothetical protein